MLRPLTYKYHIVSKGQSFVNYLLLDVIFNNTILENNLSFTIALVIGKYRNIISSFGDEYLNSVNEVFDICKKLNSDQLKTLRRAVHHNNKIEKLCSGELTPVTYREINRIDTTLSIEIQKICGRLYKYIIDRQPFYSVYGTKGNFYKEIIGEETVCSCCGVGTMLNKHQNPVGALDHYFPINHYPFSSINFKNLVPICDICNSKYKTQKDTLFTIKVRTKRGIKIQNIRKFRAFYPYSTNYEMIEVSVSITNDDLTNLSKNDITIDYSLPNYDEEIKNWERMFNVSEVHKANLLDNSTRSFINTQFDMMKLGITFDQCCDLYTNNLFYDKNFIRIPYLREFYRILNQ